MMHSIFLLAVITMFMATIGYPVWMFVRANMSSRRINKSYNYQPTISIILPCHNEEKRIEEKLRNILEIKYDHSKLELVLISDGSTDQTNEIIENFNSPVPLKFIKLTERGGKPNALNTGVTAASGEILVFSDTRQCFNKNALRRLISNLNDPKVGGVSGTLIDYSKADNHTPEKTIPKSKKLLRLVRNYENMLKENESRVHSIVGVYGSLYAIRKELYKPLPLNIILDDMLVPFKVILQGFRVVFEKGAIAYEKTKADPEVEVHRRNRIFVGIFQLFFKHPELLNPRKNPVLLQLIWHKYIRIFFPLLFITIFLTNPFMLHRAFYLAFFVMQCLFYFMCLVSLFNRKEKNVFYLFTKFNFAIIKGFFFFLRGKYTVKWQKHS
jgi:poly-beta-1,6-N-acetyl-D-glucosamine synthase